MSDRMTVADSPEGLIPTWLCFESHMLRSFSAGAVSRQRPRSPRNLGILLHQLGALELLNNTIIVIIWNKLTLITGSSLSHLDPEPQ